MVLMEQFNCELAKANGQRIKWGLLDCNTLFLMIFEPSLYELFIKEFDTYTEALDYAEVATGYRTVSDFLESNEKYSLVEGRPKVGDILCNGIHVAFHTGHKIFAIRKTRFRYRPLSEFNLSEFKIYRRK